MSDGVEGLFRLYQEEMSMCRIAEEQRSTLTNFVVVIAAAAVAYVAQRHLDAEALPITIGLIVLGGYGVIMVSKMSERIYYHLGRARTFRREIYSVVSISDLQDKLDDVAREHKARFSMIHRVRLRLLWTGLHAVICTLGIVLTIASVF